MGACQRDSDEFGLDERSAFCVIDVGSTTTKAILFRKDRQWEYQRYEAPTTVEKPYEDVTIGVGNALRGLEKLTSEQLIKDGALAVPCFATSSAGGGLAMVVAGLVRDVTARSAERVALGAGSIILQVIALDDGCTPYKKIEVLQTLRPDLVLLAGGFDGGAVFGPVFLAELLSQSGLRAKLSRNIKLPVIYSGNIEARAYVSEILQERFHYCEVPNIRPAAMVENLEPARREIHEVFMEHVMSQAPGYDKFAEFVDAPILPTPAAVSNILEHVSRHIKKKLLVVDIGGATTDVYSAINGKVFRTVSANLGMSYSILNVVAENGITAVSELLDFDIDDTELFNRIGAKYINPTSLPGDLKDATIECAIASLSIRQAVAEHQGMLHGVSLSLSDEDLGWNRLKRMVRKGKRKSDKPSLAGYDLIIGSGGKLSHSPRETAAMILINALEPEQTVDLAVDSAFMFPQLGVLAQTNIELALKLFFEIGLVPLGKLVAPVGRAKAGAKVLDIKWESADGTHEESVVYGEFRRIPVEKATEFVIKARKLKLNAGEVSLDDSQPGLIVDTRGRPAESLRGFDLPADYRPPVRESIFAGQRLVEHGSITVVRELAISGEVYVKAGDTVASETVIARSVKTFLRPFFIDIATRLRIPPDEAESYLQKRIGDRIDRREILAEKRGVVDHKVIRSGVSGILEKILPNGAVVIREEQEQIAGLQAVNVAEELRIRPERVKSCLRCGVGQE
ncbi:MAG: glutamate mutase L, partial [bacterium]